MSNNQEQSVDIGWIQDLSAAEACAEDARRRGLGQIAILKVLGIRGASSEQLFWTEARGRLRAGDEIGPIVIGHQTECPVVGIAVWRGQQPFTEKPRCWTNVIPTHTSESSPIPQSLIHDDLVRQAMFDALTLPGDELRQVSKDIVNQGLRPIHSIELSLPMVMSTTDSVGTHNDELKIYAFKAYDALAGHFGSREHWGAWDIAAYYSEGDDANTSVHLGVFTQKVRNQ